MDSLILPRSLQHDGLTERQYAATVTLLESRIRELELQLLDDGWRPIAAGSSRGFDRDALDRLVDLARVSYLKNPLINRAVEIGALYVWGQDLSRSAADDNVQAMLDRFWRDNRATLTGQQASRSLEVELEVAGNLFFAFFPDDQTGRVRVRGVPMEEIREIITNPEDRYEPWLYRREWKAKRLDGTAEDAVAYYPDWHYPAEADRPTSIDGHEIRWNAPVAHLKIGGFPHWLWGISEVYPALDWARAYKTLLEDDATRSRALARFAWQVTTESGQAGVAAAKTKLGTTLGVANTGETNPAPVAGSTWIGGKGIQLDPIKIAGATLDPDHSRPARLMTSAGLGVPDHFFDADVGNFATSKTLDRPTELRYAERRQMWLDFYDDLGQWLIEKDLAAPAGILTGTLPDDARAIDFSFPDLLERSVTERVQAIVQAATLSGNDAAGTIAEETVSRQLLSALGVEDIDGELEKLQDELDAKAEEEPTPPPFNPAQAQAAFMQAVRGLEEAIRGRLD